MPKAWPTEEKSDKLVFVFLKPQTLLWNHFRHPWTVAPVLLREDLLMTTSLSENVSGLPQFYRILDSISQAPPQGSHSLWLLLERLGRTLSSCNTLKDHLYLFLRLLLRLQSLVFCGFTMACLVIGSFLLILHGIHWGSWFCGLVCFTSC